MRVQSRIVCRRRHGSRRRTPYVRSRQCLAISTAILGSRYCGAPRRAPSWREREGTRPRPIAGHLPHRSPSPRDADSSSGLARPYPIAAPLPLLPSFPIRP